MYPLKLTVTALIMISICKSSFGGLPVEGAQKDDKASTDDASNLVSSTEIAEEAETKGPPEYITNKKDACKSILLDGFYVEDNEARNNFSSVYLCLTPRFIDAVFEVATNAKESYEEKKYREFKRLIYHKCFAYLMDNTTIDFTEHDIYPNKFCNKKAEKEYDNLEGRFKTELKNPSNLTLVCRDLIASILSLPDVDTATTLLTFKIINTKLTRHNLSYEGVTGNPLYDNSVDIEMEEKAKQEEEEEEQQQQQKESEGKNEENDDNTNHSSTQEETQKQEIAETNSNNAYGRKDNYKEEKSTTTAPNKEEEKKENNVNEDQEPPNHHMLQERLNLDYLIKLFVKPYFYLFYQIIKQYDQNAFPTIGSFCDKIGIDLINEHGISVPKRHKKTEGSEMKETFEDDIEEELVGYE